MNGEDEDTVPKPEKGVGEAADTGLESEDADAADERLKGDGSAVGAAGLGVIPVAGAAELENGPKLEKLDGGAGIVAGVEVGGLRKETGAAGTEGLLGGGLGALHVFA